MPAPTQAEFDSQARAVALAYIGFVSAADALNGIAVRLREAHTPDASNLPTLGRVPATGDRRQPADGGDRPRLRAAEPTDARKWTVRPRCSCPDPTPHARR